MSEELKEACRLLFECMDELRLHDDEYNHITSASLKERLKVFFEKFNTEQVLDELLIRPLADPPIVGRFKATVSRTITAPVYPIEDE